MQKGPFSRSGFHAKRYVITGILTAIPIWVTWWVFLFLFREASQLGAPGVRALARLIQPHAPPVAAFISQPAFQAALAVLLTLFVLYFLGWLASLVIGRRLLALFDSLMARIPLVERIYGLSRSLLNALQKRPEQVERVVLIRFPYPGMKAVGFVTRTFQDADTGRPLAAVYVPTTPNPTSGYMEIVPVEDLISTDWTVDEAVSFIISAGAVGPGSVRFENGSERSAPDEVAAAAVQRRDTP